MTLEQSRIAAGRTHKRVDLKVNSVKLTRSANVKQNAISVYDSQLESWVSTSFPPRVEGHVMVYTPFDGVIATMYVGVNISGTLTWVAAAPTPQPTDPATGAPWDPRAVFYSPLAS